MTALGLALTLTHARLEQYKEMASVLHMYVYQLLAEREGRRGIVSRTERAAATADDEADKVQGRGAAGVGVPWLS